MTVKQFLDASGMNIHQLCQATGIAYSTLHPHVKHGKKIGERTARRLQEWSDGQINAAQVLGLKAA